MRKTKIKKIQCLETKHDFKESSKEFYVSWIRNKKFKMNYAFKDTVDLNKVHIEYVENNKLITKLKCGRKNVLKLFSEKKVPFFLYSSIPYVFHDQKLILIAGIAGDPQYIVDDGPGFEIIF